jgi:hypothetical protein
MLNAIPHSKNDKFSDFNDQEISKRTNLNTTTARDQDMEKEKYKTKIPASKQALGSRNSLLRY